MGRGRGGSLCALWGGISLGVGTLSYALFSPSSSGCSTSIVVLTKSAVTARGCAAFAVVAHLGIGLMVLGAVLLLGSFLLAVRTRRHTTGATAAGAVESGEAGATATVEAAPSAVSAALDPEPLRAPPSAPVARPEPAYEPEPAYAAETTYDPEPTYARAPVRAPAPPRAPEPERVSTPIAPGDDLSVGAGPLGGAVRLPPGWYGNPNNPGRPVQWWDGTKLTDRPGG